MSMKKAKCRKSTLPGKKPESFMHIYLLVSHHSGTHDVVLLFLKSLDIFIHPLMLTLFSVRSGSWDKVYVGVDSTNTLQVMVL